LFEILISLTRPNAVARTVGLCATKSAAQVFDYARRFTWFYRHF